MRPEGPTQGYRVEYGWTADAGPDQGFLSPGEPELAVLRPRGERMQASGPVNVKLERVIEVP